MKTVYLLAACGLCSMAGLPSLSSAFETSLFFSPYKDTSLNMNWNTNVISTRVRGQSQPVPLLPYKEPSNSTEDNSQSQLLLGNKAVTWAFATGECGSETWANLPGQTLAEANIKRFVQNDIDYVISTGGANGVFTCASKEGMEKFIERYQSKNFAGVDFDIEYGNEADLTALMQSTAAVQQEYKSKGKRLPVSLSLATLGEPDTSTQLLNDYGIMALAAAKASKLDFTVNLLTMNYGPAGCTHSAGGSCDMAASAINATKSLHIVHNIPYNRIALTPMIGINNQTAEITTVADIKKITAFARKNQLAGLHYWSFDRDTPCTSGGQYVSPTCSGVNEPPLAFDRAFLDALKPPAKGEL